MALSMTTAWPAGHSALRAFGLLAGSLLFASAAHGQELVHTFKNPSFGGNPFYSDHLLAIANLDRPKAPTTTTTPTADELLVSQIRSSLTSTLSSQILSQIQNAKPGDTGEFVIGDQRISYTKTATATTVTFTNTKTGETSQLVVPVSTATTTNPFPFSASSAEAVLGTLGSSSAANGSSLGTVGLLDQPPL